MKKALFVIGFVLGLLITNAGASECNPSIDTKCVVRLSYKRCDTHGKCVTDYEHTCYKLYNCEKDLDSGKWKWLPWSCSPTPGNEPACPSETSATD